MGTEWDLRLLTPELKEKQAMLQGRVTEILDAVNELREQTEILSGLWQGNAKEIFCTGFTKELTELFDCAEEMGRTVNLLTDVENFFEICEQQVSAIMD